LGQLYARNGQIAEAQQAYGDAQRIAPQDVRVYQNLGNLYFHESDFAAASKTWEAAVRLGPDRAELRSLLAASYVSQGRFLEAEAELREALRRQKTRGILLELGHVLLYQSREPEAAGVLSQACAIDGGDSWTWLYLGLACRRTGRLGEAQTAFSRGLILAERAVEREPRSGSLRALLGYLCAQSGDTRRGRAEAAQALQLAPADNDTLWWSALTYERAGSRADALKTLGRAPRQVLDDLRRWPEAAPLIADPEFGRQR
jgi:Flp pilus assembly protein TadD